MSAPECVVRNGRWQDRLHDVVIGQGRIVDLLPADSARCFEGLECIEARGAMLLPGLIDGHTHVREPGQEHKEDIDTGLKAAAQGGFGHILCMANTDPVNDCAAVTRLQIQRAVSSHPQGPFLHPVGAVSKGLAGLELAPYFELAEAGCIALSNDGLPVTDNHLFRRALEYSTGPGLLVIDHCEDPGLAAGGQVNEGLISDTLGLPGQPCIAESIQVARDILLSKYLHIPVHLAHISTRESVELIARAKQEGVPVTAETCPHYLLWDEELVRGYFTLAKVNPPLRTSDDVLALRQAVREGVIDILVTDHAPHADFEKDAPFAQAPNGISGLDTALSLSWSLVQDQILSLTDLIQLWSSAPAALYGLKTNSFTPGAPADICIFDPEASWTVTAESMASKGKNSPCLGQVLPGRVKALMLQGRLIYEHA
ncbi:MAG: dihydroorotase [Desulfovermiculus sp.]